MKQIFPDLWQTPTEHPFPGVNTHAYLLTQENGNILFYSASLRQEQPQIQALGGIACQFLSHKHEAGPALARIKQSFGSKLFYHRFEKAEIEQFAPADYLFEHRETRQGNIEIIPTPGHTPGSTCFLVHSVHGQKYLFTGDTVYPNGSGWETRCKQIEGGSRADLRQSLMLLRQLSPDVVISSASIGDAAFKSVDNEEWQSAIDKLVAAL
ncbi:MAG: MBL fold metallo-hydrolase [Neisseria sp.]|nr:MBL fold metallo-hydrolase [Neisseria sp.]